MNKKGIEFILSFKCFFIMLILTFIVYFIFQIDSIIIIMSMYITFTAMLNFYLAIENLKGYAIKFRTIHYKRRILGTMVITLFIILLSSILYSEGWESRGIIILNVYMLIFYFALSGFNLVFELGFLCFSRDNIYALGKTIKRVEIEEMILREEEKKHILKLKLKDEEMEIFLTKKSFEELKLSGLIK